MIRDEGKYGFELLSDRKRNLDMRRGYADGPYGQVHFQDSEKGIPLILCHQAPMSLRQFDSVYNLLALRGIRAIGIDMPGFGMSEPPNFVPTIEDYARPIPSVLDQLGLDRAFVLGHHTGALVATEIALQFPERVIALILNGPLPMTQEQRQSGLAYVEEFEKGFRTRPDGEHFLTLFKSRLSYANELTNWNLANRYIAEQLISLGPFWYGHHAAFQYDHAAALLRIQHPTLVLTNTGDSIYENAKETMKLRSDFSFLEIEGGSIDIIDEKPEEWVRMVISYIMGILH